VSGADEAINLGSVEHAQVNPFLDISYLIQIAKQARADAIHPGYGYLSENSQFADAVRESGMVFIGPSSTAMSTLGDKRQAKQYLSKNEPGIPLIPGWNGSGDEMDINQLEKEAEAIGYPVMIKASAGGGGKGMRIVHSSSLLKSELERAQSEAKRAFGSSECILEKYIEAGKHVEVQIMGDKTGKVLSLWERDCSVQRRHQKVIEESPCAWLAPELRKKMCDTAVKIGELLKYEGAGTVEFILDIVTGNFYFLEVNARLQVEHPITEECTGLDLVSLQIYVASGGELSKVPQLNTIPQTGNAIECRLCAEDPIRDFAPQHGLVRFWEPATPDHPRDVRFETAIETGTRVSIFFDSMIAKIVVWAPTRDLAIKKMVRTLSETACIGLSTNQCFLQACLMHEKFHSVDYTTAFIPSNLDRLLENPHLKYFGLSLQEFSAIPSMFIRELKSQSKLEQSRKVFGSIRRGSRNQTLDRVNVPWDIVTRYDSKAGSTVESTVCRWLQESQIPSSDGLRVQVAPMPPPKTRVEDAEANGPEEATIAYNTLSAALRRGALPASKQLDLQLHELRFFSAGLDTAHTWKVGCLRLSASGQKYAVTLVSVDDRALHFESDMGTPNKILAHIPALGAPFEFHCYSPLSYYESLRASASGRREASSKTILAPMPCKVLRVEKKNGEEVKTGEVVMVVESMKMEITITAGRDGAFYTPLKEGDSADEGSLLCNLE
jgi:acetyl/propionyl-CoA carboxylase alpha subunit